MKQQSLATNSKRKRKILLGTLIPLAVAGVALAVVLPLTVCHSKKSDTPPFTSTTMPWSEAKNYFDYPDGIMTSFKGGNGNTEETTFLKVCAEKGYTEVEFGSEITSIGAYAFQNCAGFGSGSPIRTISVTSVSSIGAYAFYACAGLTSISVPNTGLTLNASIDTTFSPIPIPAIGTQAFWGCANFTGFTGGTLTIVNNTNAAASGISFPVPSIGRSAFRGCAIDTNFIHRFVFPTPANDATPLFVQGDANFAYIAPAPSNFKLGTDCMSDADSGCLLAGSIPFTSLSLTSNSIGLSAFQGCASLESISFSSPATLTSIGAYAFQDCANFTGFTGTSTTVVTIGGTDASAIGLSAFQGCAKLTVDALKKISVISTNTKIQRIVGQNDEFIYFSSLPTDGFALGNTPIYREGGGCLLAGSIPFTSLSLTSNSIGSQAFYGCASLESISIPSSTDITLATTSSASLAIGSNAFDGCANFAGFTGGTVKLSNTTGEPTIGYGAFIGCAKLDIDFIKKINLADITGAERLELYSDGSTYAYIAPPSSSFTLGTDAMFQENSGCLLAGAIPFTSLSLISNAIGSVAFAGCASLTAIDLSNVTAIGTQAFWGCASLNHFIFN